MTLRMAQRRGFRVAFFPVLAALQKAGFDDRIARRGPPIAPVRRPAIRREGGDGLSGRREASKQFAR